MDLIVVVDSFFLSFFTKISHKFCRLTGRTNFFLAKLMVCVTLACTMIMVLGYWLPLFPTKLPVIFVVLAGLLNIKCLIEMNLCDKAENAALNDERVRIFNPLNYVPILRILWVYATIVISWMLIYAFTINSKGIFIAEAVLVSYAPSITAFKYLVSVDPPTPGKSKIREWAESFSAGFRKLVPIKAKN